MPFLMDLVYAAALVAGIPWLLYRRWTRGRSDAPLREYFGRVPSRPVSADCVWLHGVSLGEINATRTLVAELHRRSPSTALVISSTTGTGRAQARKLYPQLVTFRFPLDFSFAINAALDRLRPSVIVLMELEAWPNLVELATERGIAVIIANGRVTEDRTMRRFRRPIIRRIGRRMFGRLTWVGAQDELYRLRFIELGVPADRIEVTGSVKYDAADVTDCVPGQAQLAQEMGLDPARPLLVCGSTGPGEEALILDAYAALLAQHPDLQLALIPRKPERFDEVCRLIVERGYACLRRSTGGPVVPAGVVEPRPVFLGDTMGELRKFYGLAAVVFVGRSLVPMGGSDVMEVAALARPVLVGPHTENFTEAVNLLLSEEACRRVTSAESLATAVNDLLRHPQRRQAMGEAGRAAIRSRRGATERTVNQILALL